MVNEFTQFNVFLNNFPLKFRKSFYESQKTAVVMVGPKKAGLYEDRNAEHDISPHIWSTVGS